SLTPIVEFSTIDGMPTPNWTLRFGLEIDEDNNAWQPVRHRGKDKDNQLYLEAIYSIGHKLIDYKRGKRIRVQIQSTLMNTSYNGEYDKVGNILCCAYGASRRMEKRGSSDNKKMDSADSLFDDDIALINAEAWLLQADMVSQDSPIKELAVKRREQIKRI